MNDYANFYRQIAEMERQATRGQRRNRASIGPGPAWERTPEANGGRGQPLPQQAPEWSSALRSARVSQGMAPEATDQPLDPVALARLRGETLEQRYSPLSEDWGWLDLGAGLGVAAGETFVDSLASPFSEGARLRNDARRTMLRDVGEGFADALDSWTLDNPGSRDWDTPSNFWADRQGATNINEAFSGSPGQNRRADVQQTLADMDARSEGFWVEPDLTITAESRPDTLTRLGAVGSDLWRGPSEAARTGRREYPVYLALEQQAREAGDVAAADEYGRMANAAALSDAVNTGSGALEAAPGIGLADTLLGLGRFTGRQGLRAAGREIPYYMNPVDWSSTAAYAGRADEAMLDPGMLTRQAEPIRNAVLAAPVGAVAADQLMDGDAGDANQLAGGALITGGAIAGLPMALRGGEEFVRRRLGRTDPLADIAPRVADDAPFAFEGAPQAGRVIDAEATPAPARNFEAAVRDPETGQVYRGQDHLEAIDSAPDEAVRARLQAAYDAVDEDPSIIGFQVDGEFMGREQGMDALRARAGRSRQVRIGEQVNRDGSVTPRSEIDWDSPNTRLPADDEWFNNLAGMPTPPRMNIVPDGGIPGRSADDMLREPRRLGAESAPDGGASGAGNRGDLFPGSAPGPVQVLEGEIIPPSRGGVSTTPSDGAVAGVVGALEPMIPEMRAAQADIRRVLGDEEYFAPRQPIDVDALEPNRRAIARASVALEEFVAQNRALRAEQAARALPDGGASGAGNVATPLYDAFGNQVNMGLPPLPEMGPILPELGANDRGAIERAAALLRGENTSREATYPLGVRRVFDNHGPASEGFRRIEATREQQFDFDPQNIERRRNPWPEPRLAVDNPAPDAPNAGPRRLGGDDTPAAATISAGGLGGYALGEMLDDEAQAADGSESDGAMLPILTAGGGAAALYAMRRGRLGEQFGDSVGMSGGRGARRLGGERGANPDLGLNAVETEARTAGEQTGLSAAQRGALTPDQSYIIERRMQGADYNTIADEMSTAERPVTTNTVTVQISKARRRLSDAGMPLDMASAPMGRPSYAAATDEQIIALRDQLRSSGEGNARGGVNTIIAERFGMTPNAVAQRISNWERRRNTGAAAGLTALGGGALLLGDEAQAQSFDPNGQWIGEEQRRDVGDRTEIRQRFRDSQGRIFEGVRYQDHATGAISAPQLSPVGETPMPQLGDTYDSSEVPLRPEEIERIQAEREANGGAPPAQAPSRRLGNESRSDNTTPAWALAAPLIAGIAGGRIGREWGLRNGRPIAGEALGAAGTGSAVGAASGAFTDAKDSGELTVLGSGLGLGGRGAYRLGEAGVRQSADALANVRLPRQRVRGEPLPYVGDDVVAPMNEPGSLRPPPVRQPERMSGSLDEADLAAEMSGRAIEQGRRRLRPTPIPPEERLAIPEGERGSLDGRLATLGSEPLRELARREGLPTEGTVRDLARRLADAARQDPAALERYKRIFQALGVSSLIVGGASQLLPQDAEAVDGGEGLPSWSDEAGVGATAFGLAVLGRTAAPRALEGLVPNRARLGQLSRVSELPMDIPRRTLDLDRSRLGRVAPNRVASDVDPRLVAGGAALAVGPIAWGAAELLDPTTQSPQEQESSFLRDVMPYAEMRQQALELHSQGYTSREIRDIDPEIADEMLILEQGGNSLLNDYEVTPASIPEDIQAARAYRAREEQKRNPQRLGR